MLPEFRMHKLGRVLVLGLWALLCLASIGIVPTAQSHPDLFYWALNIVLTPMGVIAGFLFLAMFLLGWNPSPNKPAGPGGVPAAVVGRLNSLTKWIGAMLSSLIDAVIVGGALLLVNYVWKPGLEWMIMILIVVLILQAGICVVLAWFNRP